MKRLISSLVLVIGLAALGCGGGQPHATEPSTEPDTSNEPAAPGPDDYSHGPPSADRAPSASATAAETAPGGSETGPAPGESGKPHADEAPAHCRESTAKLALAVDRQSIDLDRGVLETTMDGPICKITMTITRKDAPKLETSFAYTKPRRALEWTPVPRDQIETIEIRVAGANGAYQAVTLVPWSVTIDHREVVFDTDKAVVRDSEVPALEDSLGKIKAVLQKVQNKGFGTITLFIAGHTDTRGSAERNLDLSRRRAQAIASWFMKRGLCVPIAYDGFGETVLKKMTADEVDAQENRRVDYILAVEPPAIGKGATPAWKWISKGC